MLTILTLQFVYENQFYFAGPPAFFLALPQVSGFFLAFQHSIQAFTPGHRLSDQAYTLDLCSFYFIFLQY